VKAWRHFIALAAIACLAGYIHAYSSGRAGVPIRSDAFSYYVYLPSWLLYGDPTLQSVADRCCGGDFPDWTAIVRPPFARGWVDPHPIGEAILLVPFFAAGHVATVAAGLARDGFSRYYQHAAGLAGLVYAIAGLWFLGRWLSRHFSNGVVTATLATLLFGTSLFHYATFDSLWSHAFSFVLCAALMERIDAWTTAPGARQAAIVGAIAGLMILVRHTNAMIPAAFVAAAAFVEPRVRRDVLVAAAVSALVVFPQFWIYHRVTRHWFVSAYGSLGFTWSDPHVYGVLLSPQKGLFFWAPVLIGGLAGLAWLPASWRAWRVAALAVLVADTYVIASWWDWQFGASYGHRGFVDVYPVFAAGLAAMFARVSTHATGRRIALAIVPALCALCMFQMLQYWHGVMPMSDVTWAQYRDAFLRIW